MREWTKKSKEKQKDRGKDKKKNTKEKRIKNPRDNVKDVKMN